MTTRLPTCSDAAVGSKPAYAHSGDCSTLRRSVPVVSATRPRHCSSSNTLLLLSTLMALEAGKGSDGDDDGDEEEDKDEEEEEVLLLLLLLLLLFPLLPVDQRNSCSKDTAGCTRPRASGPTTAAAVVGAAVRSARRRAMGE